MFNWPAQDHNKTTGVPLVFSDFHKHNFCLCIVCKFAFYLFYQVSVELKVVTEFVKLLYFTCGVKANMRSFKEYNLLVLSIPTSRDFLPERPSFLFLPEIKKSQIFNNVLKTIDSTV